MIEVRPLDGGLMRARVRPHRCSGAAVAVLVVAAALAAPLATQAGASGAAPVAAAGSRLVDADTWRAGGKISRSRDWLSMDSSSSGVVVAVATTRRDLDTPRATSTLARRTPDGQWTRQVAHLGEPVGVHVNARGGAVVVSVRNDAVVATTWPRRARVPRSRVVLRAEGTPDPLFDTSLAASGRGDVAVLLTAWPGYGDKAVLLRKPLHRPWRRPLVIGRPRYGGALDAMDVTPAGAVVGAFKQDQTLSVRTLPLDGNRFGPATTVTRWPEIDDSTQRYRESITSLQVGVRGDLAATWSYSKAAEEGGEPTVSLLTIKPKDGRRWQRRFGYLDQQVRLHAVAEDGAALVSPDRFVRRWNPRTRTMQGRGEWVFRAANTRGDALIGSGRHRVRLWPVGAPRRPEVPPPSGILGTMVLTSDRTAYVPKTPRAEPRSGYYLRFRRF